MRVAAYSPGTYTYELAQERFPGAEILDCGTPEGVVRKIADMGADVGVIPFYNVYARTHGVPVQYRQLLESEIYVHEVLPKGISLCCAGLPGTELSNVEVIFLMSVLRRQCDRFVDSLPGRPRLESDDINETPTAFERAASADQRAAAIGPRRAALRQGLEILSDGVENEGNTTYFFVIRPTPPVRATRQLLCLELAKSCSPEEALELLSAGLAERSTVVYGQWLEFRNPRFVIAEVDLPDEVRGNPAALNLGGVRATRLIGEVARWR